MSLNREVINEVLDCLKEIEDAIKGGGKPKFAIKSLFDITAGISSIASWVTVLGQFAGVIPPLPS